MSERNSSTDKPHADRLPPRAAQPLLYHRTQAEKPASSKQDVCPEVRQMQTSTQARPKADWHSATPSIPALEPPLQQRNKTLPLPAGSQPKSALARTELVCVWVSLP